MSEDIYVFSLALINARLAGTPAEYGLSDGTMNMSEAVFPVEKRILSGLVWKDPKRIGTTP